MGDSFDPSGVSIWVVGQLWVTCDGGGVNLCGGFTAKTATIKRATEKKATKKTATEDWATGKLGNGKIRQRKIRG